MCTILVIDDEKMVLEVVKLALTRAGFNVETALDGKTGIQKYDNGSVDLVITDIRMSGMDGNDVFRHIRNSDRQFTPIIGMSGTPWLLKNSRFDAVLPKPFGLQELLEAVKTLTATPLYEKTRPEEFLNGRQP